MWLGWCFVMLHNAYTEVAFIVYSTITIAYNALISFISRHALPAFSYPRNISNRSYYCDILSTVMLPSDVDSHIAVAYTKGDGNCLYNAVSMHLCGDCRYATELRCRAIYEMVANNSCDASEAAACSYYDKPCSQYIANMTKKFNYSGGLEIMALANIIGTCITANYPDVNKPIRQYYNRKFSPEFRTTRTRHIHIMFTRRWGMPEIPFWNPNHFALLVHKSALKGSTSWPGQSEQWGRWRNPSRLQKISWDHHRWLISLNLWIQGNGCEHNVFRVVNCDTDVSDNQEKKIGLMRPKILTQRPSRQFRFPQEIWCIHFNRNRKQACRGIAWICQRRFMSSTSLRTLSI